MDDADEDVFLGVATAFEAGVGDPSDAPEIEALLASRKMIRSVVLGQPIRAEDPEVGPGDGVACLIEHDVLGLDRDLTDLVEDPQQPLVDRLGPSHSSAGSPV